MIAWIIGIVFLLVITLFITDETVESFISKPPSVVGSKFRPDLTCSDRESSAIFDRYDKNSMESLGNDLPIPVNMRTNDLGASAGLRFDSINNADDTRYSYFKLTQGLELRNNCIGETNKNVADYQKKRGNKVFYETSTRAVNNNFNLVNVYCCKGELIQPPGTSGDNQRACLADCPDNYTKSVTDESICIRNDSTCTYSSNLSADIQDNWSKTCAALYKQNTNIISTINSISNVVSTFSFQTSSVQSNYSTLSSFAYNYSIRNNNVYSVNHNNNFSNIANQFNNLFSVQRNISDRYNTLQSDKVKFDTLFNKLDCSNYM